MRARLRGVIALLVTLLVVSSVDFESILHAHGDWTLELRSHELSQAVGSRSCDRSPHLDRSRSERHTACLACLISAGSAARPGVATWLPVPRPPELAAPGTGEIPHPAARSAPRRGRSPPRPPFRTD